MAKYGQTAMTVAGARNGALVSAHCGAMVGNRSVLVSPRQFKLWFSLTLAGCVLNATAPSVLQFLQMPPGSRPLLPDLGVSKVVLLCILFGASKYLSEVRGEIRFSEVMGLLPALLGCLAMSETAVWAGLSLSSLLLLMMRERKDAAKSGLWIVMIGAAQIPLTSLTGMLVGGSLLEFDRLLALEVLSLVFGSSSLGDAGLQVGGQRAIVLVWECGVLKSVSLVLLVWITVLNLQNRPWAPSHLVEASALVAICVCANTIRLSLMASSEAWFAFVHDGFGASLFRLSLLGAALAIGCRKARSHA